MTDDATASVPVRKRGAGAKIVYDLLRGEILNLKLAPGSPIDEVQPEDDRPAGHRRMMSPKRTGGGAAPSMCGGGLAVDAGPLFSHAAMRAGGLARRGSDLPPAPPVEEPEWRDRGCAHDSGG